MTYGYMIKYDDQKWEVSGCSTLKAAIRRCYLFAKDSLPRRIKRKVLREYKQAS